MGTCIEKRKMIQIQHDGKDYELGAMLNPQALIEAIKNNSRLAHRNKVMYIYSPRHAHAA